MVMPPIRVECGKQQFEHLECVFNAAIHSLSDLCRTRPDYAYVWENVRFRLNKIQKTLKDGSLPTKEMRNEAELGTMLRYECPDMAGTGELLALYELDNAYQLLGIKPLTPSELDTFRKTMGCQI